MRQYRFIGVAALSAGLALAGCEDGSGEQSGSVGEPPPAPQTDPLAGGETTPAPPIVRDEPELDADTPSGVVSASMFEAKGWLIPMGDDWIHEQPQAGGMRAGLWTIPGGTTPASVKVFHGIGGGVEPNLARWIAQVEEPSEPLVREYRTLPGGQTVHWITMVGTYYVDAIVGGSGKRESDMRVIGVVLEGGPSGLVFVKIDGPNSVLEPRMDQIRDMIQGIDVVDGG